MPPVTQAPLSGRYLSFAEREEIAILGARGCGVREIARRTARSPSTISRELRRNAATRGGPVEYRATTAQWHAGRRARRPKVAKLAANQALRAYVQGRLAGTITRPAGGTVPGPDVRWIGRRHGRRADRRWATSWSPEQIANRLRADFPDDEIMRVSHEAIYQALYVQGRGALKRELTACLRTGRALRVPRARTRGRGKKFVTPEVMISQRRPSGHDARRRAGTAPHHRRRPRRHAVRGAAAHRYRGADVSRMRRGHDAAHGALRRTRRGAILGMLHVFGLPGNAPTRCRTRPRPSLADQGKSEGCVGRDRRGSAVTSPTLTRRRGSGPGYRAVRAGPVRAGPGRLRPGTGRGPPDVGNGARQPRRSASKTQAEGGSSLRP